jgi:hypothetical protein
MNIRVIRILAACLAMLGQYGCQKVDPPITPSPRSQTVERLQNGQVPPRVMPVSRVLEVTRIRLAGVLSLGPRQVALMSVDNARALEYGLGDVVLDARIVDIGADQVTLDHQGQLVRFAMQESPPLTSAATPAARPEASERVAVLPGFVPNSPDAPDTPATSSRSEVGAGNPAFREAVEQAASRMNH